MTLTENFQSAVRANHGVDPFAALRRKRKKQAEDKIEAVRRMDESKRTAAGIPPKRGI